MMNRKVIYLVAVFVWTIFGIGQAQIPDVAPQQTDAILITGATIHIGNGKKIIDGSVGFSNGKIDFVGSDGNAEKTKYTTIIDAGQKHVYPAFIALNSKLGLKEIDAVRASRDYREVGEYNPHVRALVAYNAESMITPTVRTNGVLLGQIAPRGGVISGQSSVVHFDAWDWEDAVVKESDGIYVNWPRIKTWDWKTRKVKMNKKYQEQVKKLAEFLLESQAYSKRNDQVDVNLRYESMRAVFNGESKIYFRANNVQQILDGITVFHEVGLKNIVLVGGYDAWRVTDLLVDNNIPVMLRRVHALPMRKDEDIDLPFKMAKKLQDAGVLFCLENDGDMAEMNTRNLPFLAGTCVAYGLTEEEAIAALSYNAAKILGIDDMYGSIEMGKSASIFISAGDALDMQTNKVEHAFIDGRDLNLKNSQELLYEKFGKRPE